MSFTTAERIDHGVGRPELGLAILSLDKNYEKFRKRVAGRRKLIIEEFKTIYVYAAISRFSKHVFGIIN